MKIGMIQSLAFVGFGATLGFVAAARDVAPSSKAGGPAAETRTFVPETEAYGREASTPLSCSEGLPTSGDWRGEVQ